MWYDLFRTKKISLNQLVAMAFGQIATSLWFFPLAAIFFHKFRGVHFKKSGTVYLGRNVTIDNRFPELVFIGKDVWITSNCTILSHSYCSEYQKQNYGMKETTGRVEIGDGVFVGIGSIITPGVTIGKGSYIAAGSVVVKDVPANVLVGGNPATIIRSLTEGNGSMPKKQNSTP